MTMLKTYRKRRKRQRQQENRRARFMRLWGDPRLLQPLRWTNYTAQYTSGATAEELRERMRVAMKNHDFRKPLRGIEIPGSRRDEHCT